MSFAHHIEIFSIKSLPVQSDGIDVNFCWLDELQHFESDLSESAQNIDAIRKQTKENETTLIKAMDCQYRAGLYGIKNLPAIVIDKEYVAYGVGSVFQALEVLNNRDKSNA